MNIPNDRPKVLPKRSYKSDHTNLVQGKHSLTVKSDRIVVETCFGKQSFVSVYKLNEYELALNAYNRLISE